MKRINFKKGSLYYSVFFMLLGNGFFAFTQWLQLSLISKLSDTKVLGFYTLSLGIVSPIFMFSSFQLRTILITDAENKFRINDFFNFRLITTILSLLFLLSTLFFVKESGVYALILLLAGLKILESFSELFNSIQQKNENINILAYSLFLKGFASVISLLIGMIIFQSLFLSMIINLFFYLLILFFYDYRFYRKYNTDSIFQKFNKLAIKGIFFTGLPLGIVLLIISLNANISKYFLESFQGTKIQAVYSSISYILILGAFVLDALGQSFIPRLSKYYYMKQISNLKKNSLIFILVSALIGLTLYMLAFFFGETILQLLFNDYISSFHEFFTKYMLVSVLVFLSSSLGYILTAMGEFKMQPIINGIVLLINCVLSFILIKKYGLSGTIFTLSVCYLTQIVLTLVLINRKLTQLK